MLTKEDVLKVICETKEKGITREDLISGNEISKDELDKILSQLVKERKIYEMNKRIYPTDKKVEGQKVEGKKYLNKRDVKKYVTREEFQEHLQNVSERLSELKEEIDRLFDYVGDIYISIKKESGKTVKKPNFEELLMIYDNLNSKFHYKDLVPVSVFKREVMDKYSLTDSEIDEIILQLEKDEVVHLQGDAKNTKNLGKGIEINRKTFNFITWIRR